MSELHTSPLGLPLVGTLVGGKYQLDRYIAEGGMGVIAVARHLELDELVALKFLKPEIVASDPSGELARRFVREARATIKIRSEHVPRIFDVTTLEIGVPYIVMELLVGEDLDACLERQGALPIAFVVDLVLQSLEALAAAHALGMVHRDLKPANLFVSKRLDGTACVKVLDFGIAKLIDQNGAGPDHGLTGTNAVMGSPRYMSPEQMRSTRDVDGRADIWAVGTTLYELLTGRAPFEGESLTQVCAAILQDEPEAMTVRRADLPPGLEAVVRRCLAKQAADRYPNVAELAAALFPFGTSPSAYDMASRVARVLGSGTPLQPASSSVRSLPVVVAEARPAPAGVVVTNTSWGSNDASLQGRRRVWALASVFAALFVVGSVLGGLALLRSDRRPLPSVAAPAPVHPVISASAETAAVETAPTGASAATSSPRGVSTAPAASATVAVMEPPPQNPRPKGPDARPGPTSPRSGSGSGASTTTKPTSASPEGGLWDERK